MWRIIMKDYTIIYGEFFTIGSHTNQIVKYVPIRCAPEELKDEVEKTVGWDCVHYIFEGHCKQTKD